MGCATKGKAQRKAKASIENGGNYATTTNLYQFIPGYIFSPHSPPYTAMIYIEAKLVFSA